jgi:hypothetical protein
MHEQFAVVFRDAGVEAAGSLELSHDRLLLRGRAAAGDVDLEIRYADLLEVRVGSRPGERLNGYRTLVLERTDGSPLDVAPLGVALLPEIADLLVSLTGGRGQALVVAVPLKPGCLGRARKLLAQGPPLDPASMGLAAHEVYLEEDRAVFVFRGQDVRARMAEAIRHPAVWRAGLAWQRCFAGPPEIVDVSQLRLSAIPAYRWPAAPDDPGETT